MTAPMTSREELLRQIAAKAREWAGHYSPHSDGQNTFVLFAEWVESLPAPAQGKRTDLPRPSDIAAKIVDWFPQKAFMYDTYVKLQRDIASAIRIERERSPLPSTGLPAPAPHAELVPSRYVVDPTEPTFVKDQAHRDRIEKSPAPHAEVREVSLTRADIHLGSMLDEWDRLSNDERGEVHRLSPSFVGRLERLKSAVDRGGK